MLWHYIVTCTIFFPAPEDFIGIFEEILTIQPGENATCTTLTVIEDNIVEGQETLSVHVLNQSSLLTVTAPGTANINIIDNSRE